MAWASDLSDGVTEPNTSRFPGVAWPLRAWKVPGITHHVNLLGGFVLLPRIRLIYIYWRLSSRPGLSLGVRGAELIGVLWVGRGEIDAAGSYSFFEADARSSESSSTALSQRQYLERSTRR